MGPRAAVSFIGDARLASVMSDPNPTLCLTLSASRTTLGVQREEALVPSSGSRLPLLKRESFKDGRIRYNSRSECGTSLVFSALWTKGCYC